MLKFIVRRALWTIPVILLVVLMTFVMMRQIKGNPFQVTERAVPVSIQRNLDRKYHLDKPWYTQYFYYVKGVFTFDLGPSLVQRNQTVNDIIKEHFPVSLKLGALAMLWAVVLGIPLGIVAALKQRSEEHTSELQSLAYLVCRLLLEKKNNQAASAAGQP